MATQAEWETKIKSWVPSWMAQGNRSKAIISSMAKVYATFEEDMAYMISQTFIQKATGQYLELHATDRGKEYYPDDSDAENRLNITLLQSSTTCQAIEDLINATLDKGAARVRNASDSVLFLNGNSFAGERVQSASEGLNVFVVSITGQESSVSSFLSNAFLNGNTFIGGTVKGADILDRIRNIVDREKAFGVLWELHVS